MAVSRREFLRHAAAAAFVSGGLYGRVDRLVRPAVRTRQSPSRRPALPLEQHLLSGLATVTDNDTPVTVPPLHHAIVTARLAVPSTAGGLQHAQQVLEAALAELEDSGLLDFTASGLGVAVVWGLPYFRRLPPALTGAWLPVDLVASAARQETTLAILDATTYASDPAATMLEHNDVAFVFSSDHLHKISAATDALFNGPPAELLAVTSVRRGFVDAHQLGSDNQSLTKKMAMEADLPGADLIPDSAELFLGFTSTQRAILGPSVIANLETLPGLTDQWPDGYFAHGTTMHLSHLYEDLVAWYRGPFGQRSGAAFSPGAVTTVPPGTQTVPQSPGDIETLAQLKADYHAHGFVGHSTSMQPASRLGETVFDNYGNVWPAGTAVPQRADFNTLDNPFFFSSRPKADRLRSGAAAGVHFVVFMPTSDSYNRLRRAMDGHYDGGLKLGHTAVHGPFNSVLQTTHRQNFLVPPRRHRSFPLAELLT